MSYQFLSVCNQSVETKLLAMSSSLNPFLQNDLFQNLRLDCRTAKWRAHRDCVPIYLAALGRTFLFQGLLVIPHQGASAHP